MHGAALALDEGLDLGGALEVEATPLEVLDVQAEHVRGYRVVLEAPAEHEHAHACAKNLNLWLI